MALRKYLLPAKRPLRDVSSGSEDECSNAEALVSHSQSSSQNKSAKKKIYKANLTYKQQWESKYPWVFCNDVKEGMFCKLCQKYGNPPGNACGAWTTRGISRWNYATEMLKLHNESKWHKDAAIAARMAERQEQSVYSLQCAAAAKELSEKRVKNRSIILKLLRSVYFLVKHRMPHSTTTTFPDLVILQVLNGDNLLKQHIEEGPANAQYTSKFSVTSLIEAIDTWLDRKLMVDLLASPYFSVLADECEDISTHQELSMCCRFLVNGLPEEHFLTILHLLACDASSIAKGIESFFDSRNIDYRKLVGQGYDGAAVFSGKKTGVHVRIGTHSAHALYIHCSCHRLQLASIQAGESIPEIKKVFGMMKNLWTLFDNSPKKTEASPGCSQYARIEDCETQ